MKKITSIFSLGLLLSTSLLLGSCGDCESGPGCGSCSDVQNVTVDQLEQKLADAAEKLIVLSSGDANVLSYDPATSKWYIASYVTNPAGEKVLDKKDISSLIKLSEENMPIIKDGVWYVSGKSTGIPATGATGASAYEVAVAGGYTGTEAEWLASLKGKDGSNGKSAYEVAVAGGYTGTEAEWLASLKGKDGEDGKAYYDAVKGVYVKYVDGETEKTIYIPQFTKNLDGTTTINVGGTTYTIPTGGGSGGGCSCNWTLTQSGDKWTISDGTNSVQVPIVPDWVNSAEILYNSSTGQFSLKSGDKTTPIPTGYADLSVDGSGIATVTSATGTTSLKLQKTQPVVYNDGDNVAVQNYDLNGNPVGTPYLLPTAGKLSDLTNQVATINTDLTTLKNQIGTWDSAAHNGQTMAQALDSLSNAVTQLEKKVTDKMNELFKNVFNSIAKSITNIQVEEVMSNAIGSYNGVLTNLKTTKLVGYYGTFQTTKMFPSDAAGGELIPAGTVYSDTLGTIQLTVNPIGTDFSGVSVSLVNSLGQESSIKLGNLESSDKLLTTGLTRADGSTGLYKTSATVSAGDIVNDGRLHMTVDKGAIKEAAKATWNDLKAVYKEQSLSPVQGETLNKVANAIYSVVNGISTERLAIKTTYKDSLQDVNGAWVVTEKSIVSPYDLSGVVVQPLGFETLPEDTLIDKFKKLDNKVKKAIKKLNTRIAKKIIRTINKEADLANLEKQINDLQIKIKKVKPIPDSLKVLKQVVSIDTTVTVKVPIDKTITIDINKDIALEVPVEVTYELPGNFRIVSDPSMSSGYKIVYDKNADTGTASTVVKDTINFVYTKDVRIQQDIETDVHFWIEKEFTFDISDIVDNVNNALDVVTSVNGLCNSAQKIINNIYKYEDKLLAGKYLNRIYKFLDKASEYTAKGIYKLFQPVLLINSDSGFGFAGIRGVPAEVSGKVEVIPTTFSNGLVAPVYKKYISVNGKPIKGSNGKYVHNDAVLDITSALEPGMNIIEYYALDYHGQEKYLEYVVIKK